MTKSAKMLTIPLEGDLLHSPAGERYSKIVDHLLETPGKSGQVLITSYAAHEGKTTTATNLALAFHTRRIPVLLCELSLKKPAFQQLFGASPVRYGVESVLDGKQKLDAILCRQNNNGLLMAMVNQPQPDDSRLAPGDNLDSLLTSARQAYAWSVFDGPSISATPHIGAAARAFDVVLVVARRRVTSKATLTAAVAALAHPNVVVILNDELG